MLVGVSGSLCLGKGEIARFLETQGFEVLAVGGDDKGARVFPTHEALVEHATVNWRQNYVVVGIASSEQLALYTHRPFFLHVGVDAPTGVRRERYVAVRGECLLAEFVERLEQQLFPSLHQVIHAAPVYVVNGFGSTHELHAHLQQLRLTDPARLRPGWDAYFMALADLAALRANCMKRRVGCVLVKNRRVVATGYNGTPRGLVNCNEGGCARCNSNTKALATCLCLHAEENALLEAGKDRLAGGGVVLYCNTCPCLTCLVKIVQCGVEEVVYSQGYSMDEDSARVLQSGGVKLRQYRNQVKCRVGEGVGVGE